MVLGYVPFVLLVVNTPTLRLRLTLVTLVYLKFANRTPRPFTFSAYAVISNSAEYDKVGLCPSPSSGCVTDLDDSGLPNGRFINLLKTKYYGYVSSCLNQGTMNVSDLSQVFTYLYSVGSWSQAEDKRLAQLGRDSYRFNGRLENKILDTFNSSNFAHLSLYS